MFDSLDSSDYQREQEHDSEAHPRTGGSLPCLPGKALRLLPCKRIECDEIWNFCYAKDKNLPDSMKHEQGVGSSRLAWDSSS